MADIARRAGVTKAAVSFALNNRPGVSEPTRRRILAIAEELGWQPNSAARALSDGKAGAFGLVIDRPARTLGIEPFFMQLISGIQGELIRDATPLVLTMAEDQAAEIALYRSWWAQRRVDGVFLVDLQADDARVPVLEELGMPAVVIGAPVGTGRLPAVWSDDAAAVRTVLEHLAGLGHRRIARVGGPRRLRHTVIRTAAFEAFARELRVTSRIMEADYSGEQGAAATRALLADPEPPTAIVYDNDVMAVSGLTAAQALGLRVPADVSVVAWDDSALCELVHPSLTALSRDIAAYGARAARRLREAAGGLGLGDVQDTAPTLTVRGSVGAPRTVQ
ncbi:LacI family DNA-binding transcriptional regulator [Streptomyces jeddahensis]|nr:LacI family DNA-binding transcriptional regulator [Streptomyces jeddahensis]